MQKFTYKRSMKLIKYGTLYSSIKNLILFRKSVGN